MRALLLVATVSLLAAGAARAGGGGGTFDGPTIANPTRVPDFALRDQHGKLVRLSAERGNVVLLTFLYTHCPDLCPLTASNLNAAAREVGGTHVQVLAVSVDPKGDTPASVRRFVRSHHLLPSFHYLTGPVATLRKVWSAYQVTSSTKVGTHTVTSHTLYTLLIDRRGRGRVVYDSTARPYAVAHDLRLLLAR